MSEFVAQYWIYVVLAVVVTLLVALWLFAANRKTTVALDRRDGEIGGARRNQALIDAAPAASVPPATPEGLAGIGEAIDASVPPVPVDADDLTRIKGVGPKVAKLLHGLGVTTFAQIAAWDEGDVDRIDAQLGSFAGRIRRDDWRAQAALLAAEDTAAYEAKFGKL
jgi:predicted flap endonuclease-1-like 5' DNA nuclease